METQVITVSKGKAIVSFILFVSIISFPFINKQFSFIIEQKNADFTYIAKPQFTISQRDSFPHAYEKYYNENVGITTQAIAFNAYFKTAILEVSPNQSKVVVGKNNWLFMAGKPLNDYRGINLLSLEEINKIRDILHNRAVRLKEKGIQFYFALVPNKHRVYSEYLPNNVAKREGLTVYYQVLEALKEDTLIHLIDLRVPIETAKAEHVLYYKKDNHWNDIGAYVGYKSIIEHINKDFPKVTPVALNAYDLDTTVSLVGGEALQIGMDKFIKEKRVMLRPKNAMRSHPGELQNYPAPATFPYPDDFEIVKNIDDELLPTAVIIRDSFTDFMLQFFSENFKKTIFIFDNWEYKENKNIIDKEKPNIVVLEVIEQNISRISECDKM